MDKLAQRTKMQKIAEGLVNIWTLPRAMKATVDLSAVFRQGMVLGTSHPKVALQAWKEMLASAKSEDSYKNWLYDIQHHPQYELMEKSGLYIARKDSPVLTAREEAFMSNIAEKVPGLGKSFELKELPVVGKYINKFSDRLGTLKPGKFRGIDREKYISINTGAVGASERAYTQYLNSLRVGAFLDLAKNLHDAGFSYENNPKEFEDVAKIVNVFSGRGELAESLQGNAGQLLSLGLFSPRYWASRVQTLFSPIAFNMKEGRMLSKRSRMYAAKDLTLSLAQMGIVVGLASALGVKVETDPRSPNFLRMQYRNTYFDGFAGLAQQVTYMAQFLTGSKKSVNNGGIMHFNERDRHGKIKHGSLTYGSNAINIIRGKLSPEVSIPINLAYGEDYVGQPYRWSDVPKEVIPLGPTDTYEAYKYSGLGTAMAVFLLGGLGWGTSSYDTHKKKK
jgi:hypothetical protein